MTSIPERFPIFSDEWAIPIACKGLAAHGAKNRLAQVPQRFGPLHPSALPGFPKSRRCFLSFVYHQPRVLGQSKPMLSQGMRHVRVGLGRRPKVRRHFPFLFLKRHAHVHRHPLGLPEPFLYLDDDLPDRRDVRTIPREHLEAFGQSPRWSRLWPRAASLFHSATPQSHG